MHKYSHFLYGAPLVRRPNVIAKIEAAEAELFRSFKPPLGVMPFRIWKEQHPIWTFDASVQRILDLEQAMARFKQADSKYPFEWFLELGDIYAQLSIEARWYCDPTGIMRSPLLNPLFKLFGFKGYQLPTRDISYLLRLTLFNRRLRTAIISNESSSFDTPKDGEI